LGTNFGTTNGTRFATTAELSLNSSNGYAGNVTAICAQHSTIAHRAAGIINEKVQLQFENIIPEYVQVSVDSTEWTRVTDLFDVNAASQVYQIRFNDDDTAYLLFGDGVYGQRLPADAQVLINVFYGGGTVGNGIGIGLINRLYDSFPNSSNFRGVTNTSVTAGGKARASIDSIKAALPAQQRQVSGLVTKEDIPGALKRALSWLQDANVSRGFNNVSGIAVPTSTVVALPYSSDVTSMTAPQQSELATVLANRGELGVQWNYSNARKAPVSIVANVRLANKNLREQKRAEIIRALNAISGTSPFAADTLGFNNEYTKQQIQDTIMGVDGVTYVELTRFHKIPYALSVSGALSSTGSFLDVEIDEDAQDGYFEFSAISSTTASGTFNIPFKVDQLGSNYARDTSRNWTVVNYSFGTGSGNTIFNDSVGPYVSSSLGKLVLNQNHTVWATNEFSGTNWLGRYTLKIEYTEGGQTKQYYYHMSGTTFNTLRTVQDATAPLNGGPGVSASLSSSGIANVQYWVFNDITNAGTGTFVTPTGQTLGIAYNNENTCYFDSSNALTTVPIGEHSHIQLLEVVMSVGGTKSGYVSRNSALRVATSGALVTGDKIRVYTSARNADALRYKHYTEVFTLADNDIVITFT
jgi:hypothetical protein